MALYRVIIVLWLSVGCRHSSHYGVLEGRKSSDFFSSLMHKYQDNQLVISVVSVVEDTLKAKSAAVGFSDINPLELFLKQLASKKIKGKAGLAFIPVIECFLAHGYTIKKWCEVDVLDALASLILADYPSNHLVQILFKHGFNFNTRENATGAHLVHLLIRGCCDALGSFPEVYTLLDRLLDDLVKRGMDLHAVDGQYSSALEVALTWLASMDETGSDDKCNKAIDLYFDSYMKLVQVLLDHGLQVYDKHRLANPNHSLFALIANFFSQKVCDYSYLSSAKVRTLFVLLEKFIGCVERSECKKDYLNTCYRGETSGCRNPTPLYVACKLTMQSAQFAYKDTSGLRLVELLLVHGADTNFTPDTATKSILFQAVASKEVLLVELLLRHGADLSYHQHGTGDTPLHVAVHNQDVAMVQFLCKSNYLRKEHLDIPNKKGATPWSMLATTHLCCHTSSCVTCLNATAVVDLFTSLKLK